MAAVFWLRLLCSSFLRLRQAACSYGFEQAPAIEPINPFQLCKLNDFEGSPGLPPVDHFGFVEAVDGFGESIVIAVTNAADQRFDSCFRQSLGIFD